VIEVIEVRTCDLAHDKPRKGADTVGFGLDGSEYLIELCPRDRAALDKIMAEYVSHARKVRLNGAAKKNSGYRNVADRQRSRDIRAWAESQGITVSMRGRIPAEVLEQYHAAH
jgi:hypothetical protein